MANTAPPDIHLADIITALRAEIREVADRAGDDPWFTYDKIELAATAQTTGKKSGKIRLSVLDLGGEAQAGKDHGQSINIKVTLNLIKPVAASAQGVTRGIASSLTEEIDLPNPGKPQK